jgi:hypothetical protein
MSRLQTLTWWHRAFTIVATPTSVTDRRNDTLTLSIHFRNLEREPLHLEVRPISNPENIASLIRASCGLSEFDLIL